MAMSTQHGHGHAACPCPCYMGLCRCGKDLSMQHVHVLAACPCQCCKFKATQHGHRPLQGRGHAAWTKACSMESETERLHGHEHGYVNTWTLDKRGQWKTLFSQGFAEI
jgi:hypothetical protein